ncbi:MAG: FAD-dependent thymidylate synthase [Candidatus Aenigmatarchaeota archaeon]
MEAGMKVKLLAYTPNPEKICGIAARLCYKNIKTIDELEKNITEDEIKKSLDACLKSGHHSVIEHASFTFGIEGVSRALTHQLVRHRIASYSQQSQRYVDKKNFEYIIPPSIKANKKLKEKFENFMKNIPYEEFLEVPKEDARFVLPNACDTKIIVTMNARSLYNFFKLRCCTHAQWEIRMLANKMLELVKEIAPNLFKYAGPSCVFEKICREKEPCPRLQKEGAIHLWSLDKGL